MKFSPAKFALNLAVCIAAVIVGALAWMGMIAEFWFIPALLTASATLPLAWYLCIPFGKAKENEALERVKARRESEE